MVKVKGGTSANHENRLAKGSASALGGGRVRMRRQLARGRWHALRQDGRSQRATCRHEGEQVTSTEKIGGCNAVVCGWMDVTHVSNETVSGGAPSSARARGGARIRHSSPPVYYTLRAYFAYFFAIFCQALAQPLSPAHQLAAACGQNAFADGHCAHARTRCRSSASLHADAPIGSTITYKVCAPS